MGFATWLLRQRRRGDLVGALAQEACGDPTWPGDIWTSDQLFDYLEGVGATEVQLEAAARAWSEWLALETPLSSTSAELRELSAGDETWRQAA